MIRRILALSAVAASLLMAGCASPGVGGGNYTRAQTRGEQSVRLGTVESVRDVIIDADNTGAGSLQALPLAVLQAPPWAVVIAPMRRVPLWVRWSAV